LEEPWIVYLGLLISSIKMERLSGLLDRLKLTNDQKEKIEKGLLLSREYMETNGSEPSKIFHLFHGQPNESLAITACLAAPGTSVRRSILFYLEELMSVRTILSGRDLLDMGMNPGPAVGEMLTRLLDARLDGLIKTEADERQFVSLNLKGK